MADQLGVKGPNVVLRQQGKANANASSTIGGSASIGMLVSGMIPITTKNSASLSISRDIMAMIPALGKVEAEKVTTRAISAIDLGLDMINLMRQDLTPMTPLPDSVKTDDSRWNEQLMYWQKPKEMAPGAHPGGDAVLRRPIETIRAQRDDEVLTPIAGNYMKNRNLDDPDYTAINVSVSLWVVSGGIGIIRDANSHVYVNRSLGGGKGLFIAGNIAWGVFTRENGERDSKKMS